MKGKVVLSCTLGPRTEEIEFEIPEGWRNLTGEYEGMTAIEIEEDGTLCPKHAPAAEWFAHNCPGCVASWPRCGLGESYQTSDSRTLTEAQLDIVRKGVCPFRVNGTFTTYRVGGEITIGEMDLRAREVPEDAAAGGEVLADAIQVYIRAYPTHERPRWG